MHFINEKNTDKIETVYAAISIKMIKNQYLAINLNITLHAKRFHLIKQDKMINIKLALIRPFR